MVQEVRILPDVTHVVSEKQPTVAKQRELMLVL